MTCAEEGHYLEGVEQAPTSVHAFAVTPSPAACRGALAQSATCWSAPLSALVLASPREGQSEVKVIIFNYFPKKILANTLECVSLSRPEII